MRRILLFTIPLFAVSLCHAQLDGWTKGKGNTDMAFSTTFEQGTGFYAGTEKIDLTRTKLVASIFAARGITKDLDLILSVPYVNISGSGGLQDLSVWAKYVPIQTMIGSNWKMSIALGAGYSFPMGDYQTESISAIGQQATSANFMGLAQFQNFNNGFFFNFSSGYFIKSDPTPDLVPFQFKAGLAKAKYYLEIYLDAGSSQGGKDYLGQGELAPSTFKEIGPNWLKAGGKYYRPIGDKFGYSVEAFATITGRNYDDSIGLAGAFIWKLKAKPKGDQQ